MKKIHSLLSNTAKFQSTVIRHTYLKTSVAIAVLTIASSAPSVHAQDKPSARFKFAPQYYPQEQARYPRTHYGTNVHFPERNLQTPTSVKAGSVPNVNSLFGFNPSFMVQSANTNVAWQNPALPVIPVQKPGYAAHNQSLPEPRAPRSSVRQSEKPVVSKTASAGVSPSRKQPGLNSKPTNSSRQPNDQRPAKPAKILKYDNGMFDPGSTHPGLYNTDSHATTSLSGKILR
jgi:hypothetical protein